MNFYFELNRIKKLLLLAVVVFFGSLWLQTNCQNLNVELFQWINHQSTLMWPSFWMFLTNLGDTSILWPMMLPLMRQHAKAVISAAAAIPIGGALSWGLKAAFNSPRPAAVLIDTDITIVGVKLLEHGFPSGHTITAFAACFALYAGVNWRSEKFSSGLLQCALFVLAFAIGVSRIMVGAHWPWDVLAGSAVGMLSGLSAALLVERSNLFESKKIQFTVLVLINLMAVSHLFKRDLDPSYYACVGIALLAVLWGDVLYFKKQK